MCLGVHFETADVGGPVLKEEERPSWYQEPRELGKIWLIDSHSPDCHYVKRALKFRSPNRLFVSRRQDAGSKRNGPRGLEKEHRLSSPGLDHGQKCRIGREREWNGRRSASAADVDDAATGLRVARGRYRLNEQPIDRVWREINQVHRGQIDLAIPGSE
jgi:hypothetical protein